MLFNKYIRKAMRTLFISIYIQTLFFASMPLVDLLFNISFSDDKSNLYLEKDAIKTTDHATVFNFGQSRFNNLSHKTIYDESEIQSLYDTNWDNFALKTVILDPGHGGKDDGTSGENGVKEKDIALAIAKRLGAYINTNYPNVNIVYTRQTDVFIPLKKRAKIANDKNADLFISIHCNAFKKSSVKGVETYVMGLDRANENMEVIKRENDVVQLEENYENEYDDYGVDENSPLYDIIMNSYQNAYLDQSLILAQSLDSKFKDTGRASRGVHQAGFLVLRRTAMPSVLVETGYLSNTKEMNDLSTQKGQDEIAYNIYAAFSEFKFKMEKKYTGPKDSQAPSTITKTISPSKSVLKPIQSIPDKVNSSDKQKVSVLPNPRVVSKKNNSLQKNIVFGIQLASVKEKLDLNTSKWKPLVSRIVIEKSKDGYYRYILKGFQQDFKKAKKEKKELEKMGFEGSFVVAYKNERRIELSKAKKELSLN